MRYKFFDCDAVDSHIEYNIVGQDYQTLIALCARYCSSFSVIVKRTDTDLIAQMEPFRIPRPDNTTHCYPYMRPDGSGHYVRMTDEELGVRFYRMCPELCRILLTGTQGIFEWIHDWGYRNPEDPSFYREDGSVFFTSVIHEGVLTLFPRESEDVSALLSIRKWIRFED